MLSTISPRRAKRKIQDGKKKKKEKQETSEVMVWSIPIGLPSTKWMMLKNLEIILATLTWQCVRCKDGLQEKKSWPIVWVRLIAVNVNFFAHIILTEGRYAVAKNFVKDYDMLKVLVLKSILYYMK